MAKTSFSRGFQQIFTPEAKVAFVIGTLALAVLGNAFFQVLTNWLGTDSPSLVKIIVCATLVLIAAIITVSHYANRVTMISPLLGKQSPGKHKGLVLLVSYNIEPCRKAVHWHKAALQHVWLLCSVESAEKAKVLKKEIEEQGLIAETYVIQDVYDPIEFRDKVDQIYSRLPTGFQEADVILDFTGMTACASVGSVLACLNEDRPIQYTPARYDETLKAQLPLDPVEIVLNSKVLQTVPSPVVLDGAESRKTLPE